ncbi:NADPH-dependent oxidoreductase [Pontitalea aquivivens]|uniref:NADPH-dependent oxidoreductase n=1 Tax=Pontitalea aquivivens TaxID=3388663 RepID=UPI0039709691
MTDTNPHSETAPFCAGDLAEKAVFARYRDATPIGPWNATIASLLAHRSVRSFLPTPLAQGTLETLIAAASSAPTSSNLQAWSVIAITDAGRRASLARIAGNQQHIIDAPLLLVWIADLSRAQRLATDAGLNLDGLDYTDTFLVASLDAVLAAQNALIAAESLGLGTVYIGAIRNDAQAVADILELPPNAYAVVGLVIGHPDPASPTAIKPRLPQSAILHRERYRAEDPEVLVAHDRATAAFRAEQALPAQNWRSLVLGRLQTTAGLSGRERLKAALERLGFQLG